MKYPSVKIKFFLFLFAFCFSIQQTSAQSDSIIWFPKKGHFPLLEYDLLEVQPYTGLLMLNAKDTTYEGAFIPVNLAFRKSIVQWKMLGMNFDLSFGAGAYIQFEIIKFDENTLRGGLINTDYKASGYLSFVKTANKFRLQLFHISSHLGDDYIYRNQAYDLNNKSVNYEQLDFTYLRELKNVSLYGGLGYIISPNTFRKRFMTEFGVQANIPGKGKWDFAFGADVKLYDENDFKPDIHTGVGMTFNQWENQQVNFSVDGYYGHMPYSTLDLGLVYWLGLSTHLYL